MARALEGRRQLRRSLLLTVAVLAALPAWLTGERIATLHPETDQPTRTAVDGSGANQEDGTWGAGPWGELDVTPIVISPPLEYLPRELPPVQPAAWALPGMDASAVRRLLTSAGLNPEDVEALVSRARPLEGVGGDAGGVLLTPDADLIRRLPPATRAALYLELDKSDLNSAQEAAYRYFGASADDWLAGAAISPATRALVEPLIYRQGQFLFFADLDLVRPQIADRSELQSLRKRLLRQVTFIASLRVTDADDLDRITEYWGRGGRRTDIRPLLESIAEGGGRQAIDITHLLPTLARQQLYRYPRMTGADLDKPILANCLWTALNFFNAEPDDRLLDMDVAIATLKRDYYFVQDNFQLGDVVAFSDPAGNLFHAAVYIAGDLIFGKNGASALAPWTLLPLDHFEGHYLDEYERGWRLSYLRRKDL